MLRSRVRHVTSIQSFAMTSIELQAKRFAMHSTTRRRGESRWRYNMTKVICVCGCGMTAKGWTRRFSLKGALDIGVCRECASAPNCLGGNWKSGVSYIPVRKFISSLQSRLTISLLAKLDTDRQWTWE